MRPRLKNLKGFASKTKPNNSNGNNNSAASSSYLAEDENFKGFAAQLERLGLQLRDITGDGNCCFRALSDQMHGNESAHAEFRKRVCQYMRNNRNEFEPFVAALIDDEEDEEQQSNGGGGGGSAGGEIVNRIKRSSFLNKKLDAFEKYIKNLEQLGTYADNGCLVAFARLYQVNINIHQLNMPIWNISGVEGKKPVRELHLSYHNGEHYSSIRPLGDNTQTPTNINFELASSAAGGKTRGDASSSSNKKSSPSKGKSRAQGSNNNTNNNDSYSTSRINGFNCDESDDLYYQTPSSDAEQYDLNVKIEQIMDVTGCMDVGLIRELLSMNDHDAERAINSIMANRMQSVSIEDAGESDEERRGVASGKREKSSVAVSKKQEKKDRQMERQRIKILEQREKEILAAGLKEIKSRNAIGATGSSSTNTNSSSNTAAAAVAMPGSSSSADCTDFNVSLSNIETKTI